MVSRSLGVGQTFYPVLDPVQSPVGPLVVHAQAVQPEARGVAEVDIAPAAARQQLPVEVDILGLLGVEHTRGAGHGATLALHADAVDEVIGGDERVALQHRVSDHSPQVDGGAVLLGLDVARPPRGGDARGYRAQAQGEGGLEREDVGGAAVVAGHGEGSGAETPLDQEVGQFLLQAHNALVLEELVQVVRGRRALGQEIVDGPHVIGHGHGDERLGPLHAVVEIGGRRPVEALRTRQPHKFHSPGVHEVLDVVFQLHLFASGMGPDPFTDSSPSSCQSPAVCAKRCGCAL